MYNICQKRKKKEKYWSYIGKTKSIKTVPEEAQTLGLLDKGIKSVIINMLKNLKETMFTELEESMSVFSTKYTISVKSWTL